MRKALSYIMLCFLALPLHAKADSSSASTPYFMSQYFPLQIVTRTVDSVECEGWENAGGFELDPLVVYNEKAKQPSWEGEEIDSEKTDMRFLEVETPITLEEVCERVRVLESSGQAVASSTVSSTAAAVESLQPTESTKPMYVYTQRVEGREVLTFKSPLDTKPERTIEIKMQLLTDRNQLSSTRTFDFTIADENELFATGDKAILYGETVEEGTTETATVASTAERKLSRQVFARNCKATLAGRSPTDPGALLKAELSRIAKRSMLKDAQK
ncbi:MAG: hypothetical protein AB1540_01460 [Bdellovibrionota bacterium]